VSSVRRALIEVCLLQITATLVLEAAHHPLPSTPPGPGPWQWILQLSHPLFQLAYFSGPIIFLSTYRMPQIAH